MKIKIVSAISVVLALALFSGCTIKTEDGKDGKSDKVDIKTPFGSVKVDQGVDPRDTGLPLYAGAKPWVKEGKDEAANVNISSEMFGVKVVAGEFTTPDPPAKVRAFYENELKKFGKVVTCDGAYDSNMTVTKGNDEDKPVSCSDSHDSTPGNVEMKVGTQHHQHVVGVKPDGSGTRFALVYVNVRGKESGS